MKYSITQNGTPLDKKLYTLDEETKTFSSSENNLVLDFGSESGCTFSTGYDCTFKTGSYCTFKTGYDCTFNTGYDCTFNTGYGCTFKTGSDCVVVRRDVYEVIELKENVKIKLNEYSIKGYTKVEEEPTEMTIKEIEEKLNITGLKIIK